MPSQLLLGLCVALTLAMIFFIAASEIASYSSISGSCRTVAVLLHYSITSSFVWMVVQGFHLYAVVVIVLGVKLEQRLPLYHFIGWGRSGMSRDINFENF